MMANLARGTEAAAVRAGSIPGLKLRLIEDEHDPAHRIGIV